MGTAAAGLLIGIYAFPVAHFPNTIPSPSISGLIDENPKLVWAAYYLGALAKTLMDDAEAGLEKLTGC
ncbi:hypothetical protein [Pseudomonas fulva]|uniref:hypothetical protein n=1 Tax=Pseudomonas fulva TaxID=47880 RepID=UPI003461E3F1